MGWKASLYQAVWGLPPGPPRLLCREWVQAWGARVTRQVWKPRKFSFVTERVAFLGKGSTRSRKRRGHPALATSPPVSQGFPPDLGTPWGHFWSHRQPPWGLEELSRTEGP